MDSCKDRTRKDQVSLEKNNVRRDHVSFQSLKVDPHSEAADFPDSRIKIPDLAYIFNPIRDNVKPYHLDGDTTMYTETSIAYRNGLKSDPIVVTSINDFMSLYQTDNSGSINRREYERMYGKMCKVLRSSIDLSDYTKILDEEWKKDSKGYEKMNKDMIFDCLFELADIWCPNIDPEEYKGFFDQLKFRIRYEGQKDMSAYDILK